MATVSVSWTSSTVTIQIAWNSPADARISASPAETAVTTPLFTVATLSLEEDQTTVLSVALSGFTSAARVRVLPTSTFASETLKVTPVTGTSAVLATVITHVALQLPAVAVMVALPAPTAVTLPSFTVATVLSEVVQVTVFTVAFSGRTVAVRVRLPPISISAVVLSSCTSFTGTMVSKSTAVKVISGRIERV